MFVILYAINLYNYAAKHAENRLTWKWSHAFR